MGTLKAGACTSVIEDQSAFGSRTIVESMCAAYAAHGLRKLRESSHTLTYTLLRAHLGPILHCVQSEVDLGDLLLVLHRAERIVNVLILGAGTVHRGGRRLFLVLSSSVVDCGVKLCRAKDR